MLALLSPAKSLDFETPAPEVEYSEPRFLADAAIIAAAARELTPGELGSLMDISDRLALLNAARFDAFEVPHGPDARPAAFAFNGDTYAGLKARELDAGALDHLQERVRILSGLYGLLRPFDRILPYRLEMGTRWAPAGKGSLYRWWDMRLAAALEEELQHYEMPLVVNLASQEYFSVLGHLNAPVLTLHFKEERAGKLKVNSFAAKRARGAAARFIATEQLSSPEPLKEFGEEGWRFAPGLSSDLDWVFTRRAG